MDYQEMLFAARLREVAASLKNNAMSKQYNFVRENRDEESLNAQMAQWDAEHPVSKFFPEALLQVMQAAEFTREALKQVTFPPSVG